MKESLKELLSIASVFTTMLLLMLLFGSCDDEPKTQYMQCDECYETYSFVGEDGYYSLDYDSCGYCKAKAFVDATDCGVIRTENLATALEDIKDDEELRNNFEDVYYYLMDYIDCNSMDGEAFIDAMNESWEERK